MFPVLPLLLLLPVQKPDDLCPHEWNKHPVEEPRTKQPQHREEQPQGQYKLNIWRNSHQYSFKPYWRQKMTQQRCLQKALLPWLRPTLRKYFPKHQSELLYTHKFNESYFFNLSNLHILHVIFSTKKWWELAEGKETRKWNQKDIYYLYVKILFKYVTHVRGSSVKCSVRIGHHESLEIIKRFSIFWSDLFFFQTQYGFKSPLFEMTFRANVF